MKKIFTLFAAMLFVMTAFADARYYYRGNQNSWGATQMTVSTDGYYEYIAALSYANNGSQNNMFKIATSASSWDYGQSYLNGGFNGTDITNMGNWGSDNNACIYHTTDYYVLVYYPNTAINTTDAPIICASTTLPNGAGASGPSVYLTGTMNSWGTSQMTTTDGVTYTIENVDLAATSHQFKIKVNGSTWYGAATAGVHLTRESNTLTVTKTESKNIYLDADVVGKYTFTYNHSTKLVTVTFPEAPSYETYNVVTYKLAGDFTSWATNAIEMTSNTCRVNFTAADAPLFKIIKVTTTYRDDTNAQVGAPVSTWLGNNGTMTRENCSGWTMSDSEGNCNLTPDFGGEYIFTINPENDQLTVTYPNYTRSVTNGNYGTICLPYAATLAGATAYEIAGKTANSIVLNEVANLEAGVPYIFQATAGELVATLSGEAAAEAGSANGLIGSFEGTNVAEGMYVLANNTVKACGTGCTIAANRAYIDLDEVSAVTPAPEHRVIAIVEGTDVATALDASTGSATVVEKMVVNGQLIIIKNGVRYNALGQVVK